MEAGTEGAAPVPDFVEGHGCRGLWQLFPLLSALVKVRHVRPPSCCMKRFRSAYRERLFTVSACRSRREAASFAVSALGCRPSMVEAAFSFGQVRAIVESFDLVYCDPAPSVSTTILLQRRYGTGTVALRVPVCMFYYVTVAVEELWCLLCFPPNHSVLRRVIPKQANIHFTSRATIASCIALHQSRQTYEFACFPSHPTIPSGIALYQSRQPCACFASRPSIASCLALYQGKQTCKFACSPSRPTIASCIALYQSRQPCEFACSPSHPTIPPGIALNESRQPCEFACFAPRPTIASGIALYQSRQTCEFACFASHPTMASCTAPYQSRQTCEFACIASRPTIVSCVALYQSRQTCEFACFAPAQP